MNYFKIASIFSRVRLSQEEQSELLLELQSLPSDKQMEFYNYCKKWKLAPLVFVQISKHGWQDCFSGETLQKFQEDYDKVNSQNAQRNEEALKFLSAFESNGIDCLILKGNYLAWSAYENVGYKRMNDFDILIKKEDWDRIQDVYLELDYLPLGFGWSGEKETPAKFSHVGMAFISPNYHCIIGSQWGIKSPTTSFTVNMSEIWDSSVDFEFAGKQVKTLSPEYHLLHLILHMGVYKIGIRDCMDVFNLVRTHSVDEARLLSILRESKAIDKARFVTEICQLICPVFSDHFMNELKKSQNGFLARRLSNRLKMFSKTGDIHNSYNDYFQDVEKEVIYFNLFPKFHVKSKYYFRILRMIFFPKMDVALKFNDKSQRPTFADKLIARLKSPYFVFSLIAQEIGWKFTFLLFMKLKFDWLISLKNYFVKKESYFDYLQSKGINPKDIEKVVKNIQ